jgi:hypothetical protein
VHKHNSLSLIRPHLLQRKRVFIKGVASLEGDSLVVFYYLYAPEICGGLWQEWPYTNETTVFQCFDSSTYSRETTVVYYNVLILVLIQGRLLYYNVLILVLIQGRLL